MTVSKHCRPFAEYCSEALLFVFVSKGNAGYIWVTYYQVETVLEILLIDKQNEPNLKDNCKYVKKSGLVTKPRIINSSETDGNNYSLFSSLLESKRF